MGKKQKIYHPKTSKQIARENLKLNDKDLDIKLAKKWLIFIISQIKNLKKGFETNLDSHNVSHANSLLTISPIYTNFGIETRYIIRFLKEMATICASVKKQYKLKNHMSFSAGFQEINDWRYQRSDEIEIFINLNINHNSTEIDNNNLDVKSELEHQIQTQETKASGWIFDKSNSMKISFYKTGELEGSNYVEVQLRSSAFLNIKNDNKLCFLWSVLSFLHPCESVHANRV